MKAWASVAYDGRPEMYQGYLAASFHSGEPVASAIDGTQLSFMYCRTASEVSVPI